MKRHLLLLSCFLILASPLFAQIPNIGVYYDEEAVDLYGFSGILPDIATGYIVVRDFNQLMGGAAFSIDVDPQVTVSGVAWADGLVQGDYVTGLEIGLYAPIPVFGDQGGLLGEMTLYSFTHVNNAPITVTNHPNYATPVLADVNALQYEAEGLTSYIRFHSIAEVCVYFDEAGTLRDWAYTEGQVLYAYVMVHNAEILLQGAALKLDALDPVFTLVSTDYPAGVLQGDLYTGMEIGLYAPIPVFGPDPAILATMVLFVPENEAPVNAQFEIVPHPNYDTIVVSDTAAYQFPAVSCGVSTVDVPIPNEDSTWGGVKTLYR
jgi:hypothetical protein